MANDVLKKVEGNLTCHTEFLKNLENSKTWIESARELIRECSDTSSASRKEHLQTNLDKIKVISTFFVFLRRQLLPIQKIVI
jgi:hypothetical protein